MRVQDWQLQDVVPPWRAVMDSLYRLLIMAHAANRTIPDELRVLVPLNFPSPYREAEVPVQTVFAIRVEYTDAVTKPVLGYIL